ncbi:MAG: Na+/H+ antiporter NhaA [Porphyromonas sp.]|nr:Na+/H+ antiporter NhaA [Porphyromonas sp.]
MTATATCKTNPLKCLVRWAKGISPSIFLFGSALLAIILANSGLSTAYFRILQSPVQVSIGDWSLFQTGGRQMTVAEFINDGLMALFFFSVGLEINRELLVGSLSNMKQALMPVLAAIGGMAMPVLVFLTIEHTYPAMHGMAIPMATDIAFSLAVLGLLGDRVPITVKVFLMAFAVVDDIGGILVIAIFFSSGIKLVPLMLGMMTLALAYYLGKRGVVKRGVFYFIGGIMWLCFLHSGVHTTIAGALLALTIPHKPTVRLPELQEDVDMLKSKISAAIERQERNEVRDFVPQCEVEEMRKTEKRINRTMNPIQLMCEEMTFFVHYIVLPFFAFANSGVVLRGMGLSSFTGVTLAVALGLIVGKPLGIFGITYILNKLKVVKYPPGMTTANLFGVSIFGGIGFTVSLFIATLAYADMGAVGTDLLNQAKIGIFLGTIVSSFVGYYTLKSILKYEYAHGKGANCPEYHKYIKGEK